MEYKDLTIIITTFKSDKKIQRCLNSITESVKILIIENSDNNKFKEDIESKYSQVECILVGSNKGYSTANNIGLSKINTKFALVLNPDTILEKDTLKNFFKTAKTFPDFWLIGPGNSKNENNYKDNVLEVENIKGYAIFFNLKKFNQIFFDENYFLYFEEIDLCKRVKNENGKILIDENIKIHHEGASSVTQIVRDELELNRNWHWMWSTFYFHKKHKGFGIALIIIFPKLLSSIFKTIFFCMNKTKRNIYYHRLSGIINSILGKKSWHRPTID